MRERHRHRVLDGVQQLDDHVRDVPEGQLAPVGRTQRGPDAERVQHQGLREGSHTKNKRTKVGGKMGHARCDDDAITMTNFVCLFVLWGDMEEKKRDKI